MATLVWSIDDAGGGDTISVPRTCEFMASRGIVATWFAVPKSGGNSMSEAWKSTLRAARDGGHDLQLHGLTHEDCYEFGPPAWPATSILPSLQSQFDERGAELRARYTADALGARIAEGMAADLTVFDPEEVIDRSTWDEPHLFAQGIHHVVVNGVLVLHGGEITGAAPGRVLGPARRRGRD